MKRHGDLYASIISFENLLLAYRKAARRKRAKEPVAEFGSHLEESLLELRDELVERRWRPGPYRTFTVYEPKPRVISAAPFRDRVVHHALCNVIEPIFDTTFIRDSYATRKGKGTHRALLRFHRFAQQSRYVLMCDVSRYFPSIDHDILEGLVARKIKCPDTLRLVHLIVDSSASADESPTYFPGDELFTPLERRHGIPIGNLTSQFFANVYLNPIDHFVKEALRCRRYLRYMDDFCLFSDSKADLAAWRRAVAEQLASLRLTLKPGKSRVYRTGEGVTFVGFRVFPTHRRVVSGVARRGERRLAEAYAALCRRERSASWLRQRLAAWLGHVGWADSGGLVRKVLRAVWSGHRG
jgi:retron-type reverse transcriptase